MGNPADLFQNTAWDLTVLLQSVLLILVLRRKLYREYPAFLIYVIAALSENLVVLLTYRIWGFHSFRAWTIAWSAQAVVIGTRWFAIAEIARRILTNYKGICGLANRVLFILGICVLIYAAGFSVNQQRMLLYADRAVELCIAVSVVGLFVFARYYRLPVTSLQGQLAIGFCLYSCSFVVNDSIFERWPSTFDGPWNYLSILSYFVAVLLWIQAIRRPAESPALAVRLDISPEKYGELAQQLNSRLDVLNNRLSHLLHSEDTRS